MRSVDAECLIRSQRRRDRVRPRVPQLGGGGEHALFGAPGLASADPAPAAPAQAEEGMWTFDNFPIAAVNETYDANIDQAWLDKVRLSSVKFGGCSAGVVSGQGLVMTNNHCVATCVANLSTPQVNYAETGFTPRSRSISRPRFSRVATYSISGVMMPRRA